MTLLQSRSIEKVINVCVYKEACIVRLDCSAASEDRAAQY